MPRYNEAMRMVLLQKTAKAPDLLGCALAKHRTDNHLSVEDQAALLGIDVDGLVWLSLCRTPRPQHFQRDVESVCRRVNASVEVLIEVLKG